MHLGESLPNLSRELTTLLIAAREPGLAAQIEGLEIVERCHCNDDFCSSFRTAPKPSGAYGPNHRNVSLEPDQGMIILDVVSERIVYVEVLFRDDLRSQLASLIP
jgi:hypothetical protein